MRRHSGIHRRQTSHRRTTVAFSRDRRRRSTLHAEDRETRGIIARCVQFYGHRYSYARDIDIESSVGGSSWNVIYATAHGWVRSLKRTHRSRLGARLNASRVLLKVELYVAHDVTAAWLMRSCTRILARSLGRCGVRSGLGIPVEFSTLLRRV